MTAHRVGMDVLIRVDSPPTGLHGSVGGVFVFYGRCLRPVLCMGAVLRTGKACSVICQDCL
jgi:hypothetical protein